MFHKMQNAERGKSLTWGATHFPKQTGKKKEHAKVKVKVRDEAHGQETPSAGVDGRAGPFIAKGYEVQEVQPRRDLGLVCASTRLIAESRGNLKRALVLEPSHCFPISQE